MPPPDGPHPSTPDARLLQRSTNARVLQRNIRLYLTSHPLCWLCGARSTTVRARKPGIDAADALLHEQSEDLLAACTQHATAPPDH